MMNDIVVVFLRKNWDDENVAFDVADRQDFRSLVSKTDVGRFVLESLEGW